MIKSAAAKEKTLLVCDDDRLVLLSITSALRHAGYDVIEADNGDDAILLAREHRPDLAILDIRMDGKTGLDVAAYLKDYLGQPFIFLSAFSSEDEVARGMSYGALSYLAKPVETSRLVQEVESALARIEEAGDVINLDVAADGEQPELSTQQWVAVGVLMEKEQLDMPAAIRRLADLAASRRGGQQQVALDILAGTVRSHRDPSS